MVKYVEGDMFGPLSTDSFKGATILPHVCNDKGGFGAGFVVPLSRAYPKVRHSYLGWEDNRNHIHGPDDNPPFRLGETQFVNVNDTLFVANMVAQTLGGVRPLFYNHLARCMDAVANFVIERNDAREYQSRIVAPMFGSNLAGGDWNIIEKLIEDCWIRRGITDITIYYMPGTLPSNWSLPVDYA